MKSFRFSLSYKVWGLVCRCVFYMEEHLSIRTSHIARARYPRVVSVATVLDNRALEILNFKMQIGKTSTVLRRSWTPFSVCLSRHSCFGALLSLPLCCSSSLSCANAHPPTHTLSRTHVHTHSHVRHTLAHKHTGAHTRPLPLWGTTTWRNFSSPSCSQCCYFVCRQSEAPLSFCTVPRHDDAALGYFMDSTHTKLCSCPLQKRKTAYRRLFTGPGLFLFAPSLILLRQKRKGEKKKEKKKLKNS